MIKNQFNCNENHASENKHIELFENTNNKDIENIETYNFWKTIGEKKCKYNITEWKNILKTEIDNMKIESWTIYTIFQWVVENLLFKVRKLMKI